MIRKYEVDLVELRRCIESVCDELFADSILSERVYERITDDVEHFLDENEI